MLFNSLAFLIFFPVVFALYWFVLNRSLRIQNLFLVLASYVFYGWWDWRFLSLIVLSSFVDYQIGKRMPGSPHKKRLLFASVFLNLGLLGVFKYFNFFTESFASLLGTMGMQVDAFTLAIVLPVGISFYTFQTLSYTIDIYKERLKPTEDPIAFFAFVSFFPQLVAGPIERARHLLPQFQKKRHFNYASASSGAKQIVMGFFKKLVVADGAAVIVDMVYSNPSGFVGFPMLVATIFFTFQIYGDFSGYSDIAIGLSRILGFDLMNNFKKPYFSISLTDFWRRWHISLSSWFRDYLYIPLGGSRGSTFRTYSNIFITFVVSGLWHGANWTFVVWGAIHGAGLMIERYLYGGKVQNIGFSILKWVLTFGIVCLAWIFFRANTVGDAFFIVGNIFSDIGDYTSPGKLAIKFRGIGLQLHDLISTICFIVLLLMIELSEEKGLLEKIWKKVPMLQWVFYQVLLLLILFWGTGYSVDNFIYFQF